MIIIVNSRTMRHDLAPGCVGVCVNPVPEWESRCGSYPATGVWRFDHRVRAWTGVDPVRLPEDDASQLGIEACVFPLRADYLAGFSTTAFLVHSWTYGGGTGVGWVQMDVIQVGHVDAPARDDGPVWSVHHDRCIHVLPAYDPATDIAAALGVQVILEG